MSTFTNKPLALDDIPRHSEAPLRSIEPAYLRIMYVEQFVYFVCIAAGLFALGKWVPLFQNWNVQIAMFVFALLLFSLMLFAARKAHSNMGYALREYDFIFRKGWLFEQLQVVPLSKIQHCKIKRGPLERKYGLATLNIFTAGGAGADVSLGGLPLDTANTLKDWLVGTSPDKSIEPVNDTTHDNPLA
jgi:membrane protein YdbS with pleckstrin-like domain